MKKLLIVGLLLLSVALMAVNMPVQLPLWVDFDTSKVEPDGRAELIKLLFANNLDPVFNVTEYGLIPRETAEELAPFDLTDPITPYEVLAMLVKYFGLERDAIEYPMNAPYDNSIKTEFEELGYKDGFDYTRIWGYKEVLGDRIKLNYKKDNLTRAEYFKILVDAFVEKNKPKYNYLLDKINENKKLYLESSIVDKKEEAKKLREEAEKFQDTAKLEEVKKIEREIEKAESRAAERAYIYVFENYFLAPSEDGKALPLLMSEELYTRTDYFNREYDINVTRAEAYALFAKLALSPVKTAEELGLEVPARNIQNVVSYMKKYDGQLVFGEISLPKDIVAEIKVFDRDAILAVWEENHKDDPKFEEMKEEFEAKLDKVTDFVLVKTESGKTYILIDSADFSFMFPNDPLPPYENALKGGFVELYKNLLDEAPSKTYTKTCEAAVRERISENYIVTFKASCKTTPTFDEGKSKVKEVKVDVSSLTGAKMMVHSAWDVTKTTTMDVDKVYPYELISFDYKEDTVYQCKDSTDTTEPPDKEIFKGSEVTVYPVAARILYSTDELKVSTLEEFKNAFGSNIVSADTGVPERVHSIINFVDVLNELGVPEDASFGCMFKFSREGVEPTSKVEITNPTLHYTLLGRLVNAKFTERDKSFFSEFTTEVLPDPVSFVGNVYLIKEGSESGKVVKNAGVINELFDLQDGLPFGLSGTYTVLLEYHADDENIDEYFIRILNK
ncbi:hypothetical protein AT15_07530 [Kosmotoga arenicorallina S304]|uniref:Uncharacterized protein n=1 Tax=Kosmotoga arenicorallina S304 TaxID=1453497 RepID=A0A182C763_9BACT|nr:hypothetical protein [Kosmotoga arenicorallina]OAA31339.1 hypothetical protein AT15_07530 [Kosmotoga arenicorallina S304]